MSELEGTAEHLVVIGRGRLIVSTGVVELLAWLPDALHLRTPQPSTGDGRARAAVRGRPHDSTARPCSTSRGLAAARIADDRRSGVSGCTSSRRIASRSRRPIMHLTVDSLEFRREGMSAR